MLHEGFYAMNRLAGLRFPSYVTPLHILHLLNTLLLWLFLRRLGINPFAAAGQDTVDVEFSVAFTDEGERLSIRRPTVPVRGTKTSDTAWRPATDWQGIDQRLALL